MQINPKKHGIKSFIITLLIASLPIIIIGYSVIKKLT
jgi:hypothetical protein